MRVAAELSTDLISRHGPDGRYDYVNGAIEGLTGFLPAEVLGTDPFARVHPDDIGRLRQEAGQSHNHRIGHRRLQRTSASP